MPGGSGELVARGEHHPDRERLVLVRHDPERREPLDQVRRRARLAELPLGAAATVLPQEGADLLDSGDDVAGLEPHALHGRAVRAPCPVPR